MGGTRERILAAARSHFAEAGFDSATIRGIAGEAGVDPALVLHYFESKEGVFRAAVNVPLEPGEFLPRLLEPGLDGLGERLVLFFVTTWDSPTGSPLLSLIRSVVTNETAAALLRDFVSREILGRLIVKDEQQRDRMQEMGIRDTDKVYTTDELAPGRNIVFAASGVTDGNLLQGVRFFGDGTRTQSIVMTLSPAKVRFVDTVHLENKPDVKVRFR